MSKNCRPLGGNGDSCIRDAAPNGQQCQQLGQDWSCSFPPTQLKAALEAQESRDDRLMRNNEMVIDFESLSPHLPGVVEAFFTPPLPKGNEYRRFTEEARRLFLEDFELSDDDGPPLLVVDLEHGGDAPFSVAE